jgi:hypothetical protein
MMKSTWGKVLITGTLFAASKLVSATTLIEMDFDEMVQAASACVVAEAVGIEYANEQGRMVTLTTFKVMDTAFGDTGETITVRTDGGSRKNTKISTTEVVAGSPRFFENSQSLLLLTQNSSTSDYSIVGYSQGIFPVVNATVTLPENVGSSLSVDDALNMMNSRRNSGVTLGLPQ